MVAPKKKKTPKKTKAGKPDLRFGNSYYSKRTKHGRNGKFTPESLARACGEYVDYVAANPLIREKIASYQGTHELVKEPVMRAMTIGGMCLFLGIDKTTWGDYRDRKDFTPVCKAVEEAIYEQKFTGAAGGFLNPVIIARDLGLVDKQEKKIDANLTLNVIDGEDEL